MKKIAIILLFPLCVGLTSAAFAQTHVKQEVKKDAKKVGNKTAEIGSKAKARVTDKVYADKVGPDGQTIYMNKHAKFYWIDDKGHKQYIAKSRLKDK